MTEDNTNVSDYWEDIFPYDPYTDQIRGINTAIDTLQSDGVYLMEGPCGTGKTLIALTAGLSLVRDNSSKYQRVLVITSKKQQLSAFEDDFEEIEKRSTNNFGGLTLIGKSELCPYVQAGNIDSDDIYYRCLELRDNTHQLMAKAVEQRKTDSQVHAAYGLEIRGQHDPNERGNLSFDGIDAPVKTRIPTIGDTEYCPLYASHITNSVEEQFPLDLGEVTTGEEILKQGAKGGTCPHIEMKRMHSEASVLFGNYKHCFDPATVAGLTGDIIDENTLLICDEAHGLVSDVRNQLSYSIRYTTLKRGIQEINEVQRWLRGEGKAQKQRLANSIMRDTEIDPPDLSVCAKFLQKVRDIFQSCIIQAMQNKHDDWKSVFRAEDREEITIPLQNPSKSEVDALSKWVSQKGYDNIWKLFLKTSKLVSVIKDVISREVEGKSPDGSFAIGNVHEILNRWWIGNHTEYFREITLYPRSKIKDDPPESKPWKEGYVAEININNSIPQNEIAATLDAFGGAILMSATLSPIDIYEEVTGVKKLRDGTQPEESLVTQAIPNNEEEDENTEEMVESPDLSSIGVHSSSDRSMEEKRRKVKRSVFDLSFPQENRASIAVDAPRFTWSNRSPKEENRELRNTYKKVISTTVRATEGNVLVCMPSYDEASWASEVLIENSNVSKKVITDTSSQDAETESLKQAFFNGPPKVLTTSLRGTLTEGVDYDGDKLKGVVVCGVPITDTSTDLASAIKTAYDNRFNGKGYQYGFAVPAVRKTRQAIGRVIRGENDVGVRVLVDERYAKDTSSGGVRQYFPDSVDDEYITTSPENLPHALEQFWEGKQNH